MNILKVMNIMKVSIDKTDLTTKKFFRFEFLAAHFAKVSITGKKGNPNKHTFQYNYCWFLFTKSFSFELSKSDLLGSKKQGSSWICKNNNIHSIKNKPKVVVVLRSKHHEKVAYILEDSITQ